MNNNSPYQQTIMDLARRRRDDLPLPNATAHGERHNPLCGDTVTLSLSAATPHAVDAIAQQVRGCVLCSAAAQQMLDIVRAEKNRQALLDFCSAAENMFAGRSVPSSLAAFSPVIAHPARHECVLLPFRALADALQMLEKSSR